MFDTELIIDDLCEQGFHIIENFLDTNSYHSLHSLAKHLHQQGTFRAAKIGIKTTAHHNDAIRADSIAWLDNYHENRGVAAYLAQMQVLQNLLNFRLFLGLQEFETHLAVYPSGAFYKRHIDQFATNRSRKISCVYYLNESWCEDYGGELKLYNPNNELLKILYPFGNTFVCFMSNLPHEVCITNKTRYSIAGWMKTRDLAFTAI